jgi:hypothetical protein
MKEKGLKRRRHNRQGSDLFGHPFFAEATFISFRPQPHLPDIDGRVKPGASHPVWKTQSIITIFNI